MAPLSSSVAFSISDYTDQHKKRKTRCPGNKVVILGSSDSGKTQLLLRLAGASVSDTGIHGDFLSRVLTVGDDQHPVKLELWHTAGQEKFGSGALPSALFRRAKAAVIAYDVSSRQSFRDAVKWVSQLRERLDQQSAVHSPFTLLLVGHRVQEDAETVVKTEEGRRLAATIGAAAFVECCSESGENAERCLQTLADNIKAQTEWRCSSTAEMLSLSVERVSTKPVAASATTARHESVVANVVRKASSRSRGRFCSDDLSSATRAA